MEGGVGHKKLPLLSHLSKMLEKLPKRILPLFLGYLSLRHLAVHGGYQMLDRPSFRFSVLTHRSCDDMTTTRGDENKIIGERMFIGATMGV